jgi:hypothetical protein
MNDELLASILRSGSQSARIIIALLSHELLKYGYTETNAFIDAWFEQELKERGIA